MPNEIYDFLKKNNLTDKDETTFLKEYSDSTKARELYGFFEQNKLTTKGFDDFYGTYLKKKDWVSNTFGGGEKPINGGGLSGGRLGGSAKPVTAKDKLDFLGISDITFDAPQEQKPVVSIEQPQQKFGELPKAALGFAGEKKKPTYIDVNNPDHLAYLSERIGIEKENADPTKYGLFMSDEQKAKYRPKDAANKMAEADELMQDVSQQASKNAFDKTISEVHPTMIGRKDLQKAGLEFLRQTDPAQYKRAMTIIESGEELGDEFSYNIEKTGGGILKNNLQYVTGDEGALNNIDELVELTDKAHPEIALAKGWDIIGAYNHKKDNSATGGWWRTKPTIGQVKKWIESPELLEMFTGNEAALEQIKGKLSEMPESFNSYKLDEIPVGGMFNNFGRAILGSAESVGNIFRGDVKRQQSNLNPTLGRGTLTGNYRDPGESPALLQQLYSLEAEEKDGTITETGKQQLKALRNSTKVRDGWDKFGDGTGNLSGQVVAQALLMKGAGIGTNTIKGLSTLSNATRNTVNASIGTALNSYDQTRQQAVYNFPDDKMKQGIYTGVMTLANVASERIFKDEKVLDALKRELKGDLVNYVKNLSAQNINKAAIKKLVTEKLLKYGGQVLKESNKEAFEELVVQAVDEAMQSTMGAEGYDGDKALQRIGDTYATTMLYGGIVSGLAAKSNMAADKFNRVQIYKMATNPATYQKEIQRQFEAGEITNAEKSEKLDLLYKAAEIAAAEPPKVAALPTKKKAEYLTQQLNIAVNEGLLEGAKDPNLQSELKTNIEESQKRAKAIYESEPEVLEEITKPKPTEDDTLLEKIKSSERVNGSEQTADLDYFIGKVGEAPIASQRFGEGVVEQLLPRVPTEKLQENYDFIVKVDPESAEADAIAKELDRREQQENPPIDQVREMADENTPDEAGVSGSALKDVESTAKALEIESKNKPTIWEQVKQFIKDTAKKVGNKLGIISNEQHLSNFEKAKADWDKLSSREKKLKRADYELDDLHHTEGGYYKVGDSLIDLDLNASHLKLLLENNKFLNILNKLGVNKIHGENRPPEEMFAHYSDNKIHLNNNSAFENIRQVTNAMSHELGHHEWTKLTKEERDYVRSLPIETGMAKHYEAQEKNGGKQTSASLQEENFADYVMQYFQGKLYGDESLLNKIPTKLREMFDNKYSDLLKDNEHSEVAEAYHKAKADGTNPELVKAVEDLLGKAPTQYTEAAGVSGSALKDVDLVKDNGKKIISKALGENGNDASDFKNTKVVDDNGKPKQVFHGTWADAPFEDFKEGDTYFTDNYDTAKMFGSNREGGVDTENMDMQGKPFVMEVTDTKGKKHKMVIANTDMASIFSDLQYDVSPVGEWGKEDLNDFDASSIEHHFGVPKNKIKSFKIEERQVGKNVDDFGVSRHYINLENPLVIDAKGDIWNGSKGGNIQGKINEARKSGKYDGVIVKNIVEGGLGNPDTKQTTTYVVFNKPKAVEQSLKETTKAETPTPKDGNTSNVGGDVDAQYNERKKSIEDKLNQQLEDNKDRLDDIDEKGGTKTVRQKIYQEHTNDMVELEKWKMKEDLKKEDTPDGRIKKNSEFSSNQLTDAIPNSEVHYENKEDNGVTTITLRDKNTKKHIASIDIGTGDTIDGYAGVRIQVNGEHQGKGLSKHLYNLALTEAKKQGLKGLYTIDEMLKTPDKTIATRDNFVTRKNTDEKLKTQARKKYTNVADPNITFIENVSDKFIKKGATKLSEQSLSKPESGGKAPVTKSEGGKAESIVEGERENVREHWALSNEYRINELAEQATSEKHFKELIDKEIELESKKTPKLAQDDAESKYAVGKLTEQNQPSEELVKNIERKAESQSEADLNEVVQKADELIDTAVGVKRKKLSEINTDESRFQGRGKLNEGIVNEISKNFSDADQDPIHIWADPKDGKTYVLSGHHRYYGAKKAGRADVKVIDRTKDFTEQQAIKFAKEEANANRSMETPLERANTLREKRQRGDDKKDIAAFLDKEGKNKTFVDNLSYLNPKGKAVELLTQFERAEDKQTQKESERIADWIGEARKRNENLTNQHENEMFDYLKSEQRVTNKVEFVEKVSKASFGIRENEPLNLKKVIDKSENRIDWEDKRDELKSQVNELKSQTEKDKQTGWTGLQKDYITRLANDRFKGDADAAEKEFKKTENQEIYNKKLEDKKAELKSIQDKLAKHLLKENDLIKGDKAQQNLFEEPEPEYGKIISIDKNNPTTVEIKGEERKLPTKPAKDKQLTYTVSGFGGNGAVVTIHETPTVKGYNSGKIQHSEIFNTFNEAFEYADRLKKANVKQLYEYQSEKENKTLPATGRDITDGGRTTSLVSENNPQYGNDSPYQKALRKVREKTPQSLNETKQEPTKDIKPEQAEQKPQPEKTIVEDKQGAVGKYEEKARKIADKILKAELPDWAKADLPEGTQKSGADFDSIKKAIANATIEMGKLLDKGVEFSKAVKEAVKEIVDLLGEGNRDKIEKGFAEDYKKETGFKEPPKPPKGEEVEGEGGGITHAANEVRRMDRALPEYQKSPQTFEEWNNEAEKAIKDGYDVEKLMDKIEAGHDPTPVENAIRKIYIATIDAEIAKNPTDELLAKQKRFIQIGDLANSRAGRNLVSLKGEGSPLSSISDFYVAKMEAAGVDRLTDQQKKETKEAFDNVQKADANATAAMEAYVAEIAKLKAENELLRQKKETKTTTTPKTREEFVAQRKTLKEKLKQQLEELKAEGQKMGIASDGGLGSMIITAKMAKTIGEIAKSHVNEIGVNLKEVVRKTFEDVKDLIVGITEKDIQDVLAGEYIEPRPTRNELAAKMRDLKDEAYYINKLDRLVNGKEPRKEREKVKRNKQITELQQKIKDLQKELPPTDAELKRRLAAIKTKNENEAVKIKERISKGDFETKKKVPFLEDPEMQKKFPKEYKAALDAIVAREDARHDFDIALMKDQMAKRNLGKKGIDLAGDIIGTTKALVTGIDASGIGIQNLVAMIAHPRSAVKALPASFTDFVSAKNQERWLASVHSSELFPLAKKAGLDITEPKSLKASEREDMYTHNLLDRTIKYKGKKYIISKYITKPFERIFTGLGNRMRWNLWQRGVAKLYEDGFKWESHPEEFKALAKVLNTETGRGSLHPQVDKAFNLVSAGIWSPRLMASRMNILGLGDIGNMLAGGNKGYYGGLTPRMRAYALKDVAKFIVFGTLLMGLAGLSFADDVDLDPNSSTFGTFSVNGKRYNIWGGFTQYVRLIAKLIAGGEKKTDGTFAESNQLKTSLRFLWSKTTPAVGTGISLLNKNNADYMGKPVTGMGALENLTIPLSIRGIAKGVDREGWGSVIWTGIPSFVGVNVNYESDFNNNDGGKPQRPKIERPKPQKISRE